MTYKILSLDGGGMRGVISARILKEIEDTLRAKYKNDKLKLREYFDLIAGTSTGSILAAGIACGMSADELIEIYEKRGQDIFLEGVRRQRPWRKVPQFFGDIPFLKNIPILGNNPLYPHKEGKDRGLANVLEEKLKLRNNKGEVVNDSPTMADIENTQLLILAYDVLSRNTTWFANDDSEDACWWYYKTKLWEICTASASAPTFFPPYPLEHHNHKDGLPHIDGGVSANNPTVAAIAHALCIKEDDEKRKTKIKKPKIDEITVLSIGTGQTTRGYTYKDIKNWGLAMWAQKIPDIFLDPSAENSEHISQRIFLGIEPKNYLRLNFKLEEVKKKEDNLKIERDGKDKCLDKIKISQKVDIDDPHICKVLIKASEVYLRDGEVYYDKKENSDEMRKIKVKDAIEEFFGKKPVKPDNDENQDQKHLVEA